MGRPKIIRKAEDAKNVPVDQPIQIELAPEGQVEVKEDAAAAKAAAEAAAVAAIKASERDDDEEKTTLKKQLEEMKASAEQHKQQAAESAQREADARKQAAEREKEYKSIVLARDQAEYDAVLNALSATAAELESAQQEAAQAGENQDWANHAKASAKIGRLGARAMQLEDGKAALEAKAERAKTEREAPVQQTGDPVDNHINSIPGLLPSQKDWLKSHRELMTDPRKNTRLQNAHLDAEDKGIAPGSTAYFTFLEERLGYKKADVPTQDDDEEDDGQPNRAAVVSAPVTRDPPNAGTGRPSTTRVTLSADERSAAAAAGIDEVEYARNKLKLIEMKKNGHYTQN